ncbi:MAG: hypothetical protein VX833_01360 [Actinomycetota bacterium]|nr:hypothetical protein [Actinomycetota bacterium]
MDGPYLIDAGGQRSERFAGWVLCFLWLVLPLSVGPVVADGLHDTEEALRTTASVGLWALWGTGFLASLIPRPLSLAVVRLGGPTAFAIAVWGSSVTGLSAASLTGLMGSALVAGMALSAPVGDRFANGASYGDERRFLLRAPGAVIVATGPLAWAVTVAGLSAGPLLVAGGPLAAGIPTCLIGLPAAMLAVRAVHQLGRRWVVLVPAGLVLHDHLAVADPVLLPRAGVSFLGPAAANTAATDLTQGALGLAIEVRCKDSLELALRDGHRGPMSRRIPAQAFMCTPARPDALLAEAVNRRLVMGVGSDQTASPPPTTSSSS